MTFDELKTELLSRARVLELCPAYHLAVIATDKAGLIAASVGLFEWAYQSGIADDTLLDEFDDTDLNTYGIYKNGETISNPTTDVFFVKSGAGTITINGDNNCKVRVMGTVELTVNIEGNGYVDLKCYDECNVSVYLSGNASCAMEAIQNSIVNITAIESTAFQLTASDKAAITYDGNDSSHAIIKGYNQAQGTYSLHGPSTASVRNYNRSQIIESAPL